MILHGILALGVFLAAWGVCVLALKPKFERLSGPAGPLAGGGTPEETLEPVGTGFRRYRGTLLCALPPLFAVLAGVGMYSLFGDPDAARLRTVSSALSTPADPELLESSITILRDRVKARPGDSMSWAYLVRALWLNGDPEGAIAAHRSAEELNASSISADLDAIEAMLASPNLRGELDQEIRRLMEQASKTAPDHPRLLELQWFQAAREEDYISAAFFLESSLRHQLDPPKAQMLMESLAWTRQRLPPDRPRIEVEVVVTDASPSARWLLVFARTAADRPPVAAVRRPFNGPDVYRVTLDDAAAMQSGPAFVKGQAVQVTARLSETPDVARQQADVERVSEWRLPDAAPRLALQFLGPNANSILVSVSASPALQMDAGAAVFVVARSMNQNSMPLAAEKVPFAALPTRVLLDDRDSMLPGNSISNAGRVQVFAGLAPSGRIGDGEEYFQSKKVVTSAGREVSLTIEPSDAVPPASP